MVPRVCRSYFCNASSHLIKLSFRIAIVGMIVTNSGADASTADVSDVTLVPPNIDTIGYADALKVYIDDERAIVSRSQISTSAARRDRILNEKSTKLYRQGQIAYLDFRRAELTLKVDELDIEVAKHELAIVKTKQEYARIRIQCAEDGKEYIVRQAQNALDRGRAMLNYAKALSEKRQAEYDLVNIEFQATQRLLQRQADSHENSVIQEFSVERQLALRRQAEENVRDAENHLVTCEKNLERAIEKEKKYQS